MLSFLPRWYYIVVVPADQSTSSLTARWRTPDEMELDQVGACSSCWSGRDSQVAWHALPRPPGSSMVAPQEACSPQDAACPVQESCYPHGTVHVRVSGESHAGGLWALSSSHPPST